jgi:molybdopterin converting factor small subunit
MGVRVNINEALRYCTNGLDIVEVTGSTVGECLRQLVKQCPNIRQRLFDKDGNLVTYVGIYLNEQSVDAEGLAKPIKDEDEISIVLMVTGG